MRIALTALILSAAAALPAFAQETERTSSVASITSPEAIEREMEGARSWLELNLIDYQSAQFRQVRVVLMSPDRRNRRQVVPVVCGLVNARNRMGGYTGYQPFMHGSGLPEGWQGRLSPTAGDLCDAANPVSGEDYSARLQPATGGGAE